MMKCIFCGNEFDEKVDPSEHIIPEAMGNKDLTCDNVCQSCNRKLSPIEAKLIRSFHSKALRQYHQIKGKGRKIPDVDFGKTEIDEAPGVTARYIIKGDGKTELKVSGKSKNGTIHLDAEEFTVEKVKGIKMRREGQETPRQPYRIWFYGDEQKAEEALKKVKNTTAELEKQGIKGSQVKAGEAKPPSMLNTEITDDLGLSCALAKIAYEYYQKHFPVYVSSADAEIFRQYIFEKDVDKRELLPMKIYPSPKSNFVFKNDTHLLTAQNGYVLVVLFGYPYAVFDMHPQEEFTPDYGAKNKAVFTTVNTKDGSQRTQIVNVAEAPKRRGCN